jgi:phosphonate transport system substrate-binding protein
MLNRRHLLALVAASALTTGAQAQTAPSELVFAVVPAENAGQVADRYKDFLEYLAKETGAKVTLRIASDYAAVIEGQRAGQIHIGYYGPTAYARARMTGANITPFVTETAKGGVRGYYAVVYVKATAPFQKIEDLKGKNFGLVDPNSTSGNVVPRFALDKMGINPDSYFGKVVYTGSHVNAVMALNQGTVDAAANWWNSEDDSELMRMVTKGMVKKEDFRVIFKSDLIPASPVAYLDSLPADLKVKIEQAFLQAHVKNKSAFDKLSDGKNDPFVKVTHSEFEPVVAMNKFVDNLRKKQ